MSTKYFLVLPWRGGLNTSKNAAMLAPSELTKADNIVMAEDFSKQRRRGINYNWDNASAGTDDIIGLTEFWYGTTGRTQSIVSVSDAKNIYTYNSSGTRTTRNGGSAWSSSITTCNTLVFDNRCLIAVNGAGNVMKQLDATGGSLPTGAKDAGRSEVFTVTCGADTGGDYDGTYFTCSSPSTNYYVWFDVDAGGNDPAPVGKTGIQVSIATGDTGNTIALAIETAMEAVTPVNEFQVEVSGAVATVTVQPGAVTDAADVDVNSSTFNTFAIAITTQGLSAPKATALVEHLGRVFCNDKTNVDQLNFSETSDATIWGGTGDSGGFPVRTGDGDPDGITALAVYKGDLIVFKRTKIYRIVGHAPELFTIEPISKSIGCVGPNAVADIDGNDLIFVSDRGVHSLQATDTYGDTKQAFLSGPIQKSINTRWTKGRLKFLHARYVPTRNSVAFALTDEEFGSDANKAIWWYNIETKEWYRWTNTTCPSIALVSDTDKPRLYIGTDVTKVAQAFTESLEDKDTSGNDVGVTYNVATGYLDLENNPLVDKMFKSVGLIFSAEGTYTITLTVSIDNYADQTYTYTSTTPGVLLGVDFVLGTDKLGTDNVLQAHMKEIKGHGKLIKLDIAMSAATEQLDLQGFLIEYEVAGEQKEVISANS